LGLGYFGAAALAGRGFLWGSKKIEVFCSGRVKRLEKKMRWYHAGSYCMELWSGGALERWSFGVRGMLVWLVFKGDS
jgi:hypothetical protein